VETNRLTVTYLFVSAGVASSIAIREPRNARQLGHVSLGLSIGGIFLTIFLVIVMFGMVFGKSGGE